jgi:voltage-gated potassium channel
LLHPEKRDLRVRNGSTNMKKEQNSVYLIFILVLSILAIIALGIETVFTLDQSTMQILGFADTAVCIVFFMDFLIQSSRTENKAKYFFTWGWIDLLSSIPMLEFLRWGRAVRIIRIFRVIRGLKSAKLITKAILEKRSQSTALAIILVFLVLISISSISVLHFESTAGGNIKTAGDAVWWAVASITTVGYGDKYPITTEGRILAAFLMTAGVGLFGTISGLVASALIVPSKPKSEVEVEDLRKELEEIKQMLRDMKKEV